jgi:hypothetical protein
LLKDIFIGVGSTFLGNSIFILPKHFNLFESEFLPLTIKVLPLFFSLGGASLAFVLNKNYTKFLTICKLSQIGKILYLFFNQK